MSSYGQPELGHSYTVAVAEAADFATRHGIVDSLWDLKWRLWLEAVRKGLTLEDTRTYVVNALFRMGVGGAGAQANLALLELDDGPAPKALGAPLFDHHPWTPNIAPPAAS